MLFGTTGTARALGPDGSSIWIVGTVRIMLGAITLWACAPRLPRRAGATPRKIAVPLVVGSVGAAIYQPAFCAGVEHAGVAVGTVVALGTGPVAAGAIDVLIRRRPPSKRFIAGTIVMMCGVGALVSSQSSGNSTHTTVDLAGIGAAVAAGIGYALYAQATSMLIDRGIHPTSALAAQFTGASVLLLPCMIIAIIFGASPANIATASGVLMLAHLGVVTAGVAYVLYGWGVRVLGAATAVSITLVEPLTAGIAALIVLNEQLTATGWFGAVTILAGLSIVVRRQSASEPSTGERPG